jgi:hypothetical protein
MTLISKSKTYVDDEVLNASDLNQSIDDIVDVVNGGLDSNNLDANAVGTAEIQNNAVTAAKIETQEAWSEIGAVGKPAFTNSWVNYGSSYNTAGYMKDSLGFVHLKGLIKSGTIGSSALTLPAGYRPAKYEIFAPANVNTIAAGRLNLQTDGTVVPASPSTNGWVSLDGVVFKAV